MLEEKVLRNKACVSLHICGFSLSEIGDLLELDRRNVQFYVKKYKPRYLHSIMEKLAKNLSNGVLKPTKKGGK